MPPKIGYLACLVIAFFLGYYFGRRSRPAQAAEHDPADWWKRNEEPPY